MKTLIEQSLEKSDSCFRFLRGEKVAEYNIVSAHKEIDRIKTVWIIHRSLVGNHYINSVSYWSGIKTSDKIRSYDDTVSFEKAIKRIQKIIDKK